ncbi:hypothetical protein GCM10010259_52940 [Streptomyces daghestanicus]|uniref:Uncharacterized protein n=1 Tax=Streptomyces daghestanicus TaxID=66885 RepID=A0ABQ3Q505_9ACTN|nr:hypothetical protein GCM10010259_52940 [Streptomyces daghestanicus]GHI32329.1 hypothetical protein Sdagh_40590 [Streptomyces daghestanicus]
MGAPCAGYGGDYVAPLHCHCVSVRWGRGSGLPGRQTTGGWMAEYPVVEGESKRAALGRTLRFLREKAGKSLG